MVIHEALRSARQLGAPQPILTALELAVAAVAGLPMLSHAERAARVAQIQQTVAIFETWRRAAADQPPNAKATQRLRPIRA